MAGNTPPICIFMVGIACHLIRRLKGDSQICTSMMGWRLRHPCHGIDFWVLHEITLFPPTFSTSEDGGHATLGRTCAEPRSQQMIVTWAPPWDWCSKIWIQPIRQLF